MNGLQPGDYIDEIKHFHLFCGAGGGAMGFNRGHARVGRALARFRCLGGIDSDRAGIADFSRLVGVNGTVMDLFDADQYAAWHGKPTPATWRAATAADILAAAGGEHPDTVFTSPPCKGFSGLQSPTRAASAKYQALNALTVRSIALTLEAFQDDPPSFVILENVPRIAQRGRDLLDDIVLVLRAHGYAVAETVHDCGKVGGLGQTRKRFLLVARHTAKVPPFLYEPPSQPLRTVGDVIGELPMPETAGMSMHRLPRLEWQTWVRLALIPPGKDWRALQDLRVTDGNLQDIGIAPIGAGWHADALGVRPWDETSGTVTGRGFPTNGRFTVADPRFDKVKHNNCFRIVRFDETSPSVTGGTGPTAGGLAVADPRSTSSHEGAGKYRVSRLDAPSGTVTGTAKHDTGPWSVASWLPAAGDRPERAPLIVSLDGSWHRPFTTLELAALQGFPWQALAWGGGLFGDADARHRERIGNAVPPPAAAAVASVMGRAILQARAGVTFQLSAEPVWVQPLAIALSVVGAA